METDLTVVFWGIISAKVILDNGTDMLADQEVFRESKMFFENDITV